MKGIKKSIHDQLVNLGVALTLGCLLKVLRLVALNPYFLIIALCAVIAALTIIALSSSESIEVSIIV